jgi:periplasmic divalent cation tolerance protein
MAQMSLPYSIIFCTCPNQESAERIARSLVEAQLAACVNILPNVTSVYRWQGEVESAQELLLIIKARSDDYVAIEQHIKALHPYTVPEIIATAVQSGSLDYLHWIDSCHSFDR